MGALASHTRETIWAVVHNLHSNTPRAGVLATEAVRLRAPCNQNHALEKQADAEFKCSDFL